MRLANETDVPIVADWIGAFAAETGARFYGDKAEQARLAIGRGEYFLWVDDLVEPSVVSMAAVVGSTATSRRIGAVYTPPERRGRGYAEGLVAALSQRLLTEARTCFLYTDVNNPTSNALYARIGYRPLADVLDLEIVAVEAPTESSS
jgi:predicted GNAT family acetyltransferase